MEFPTIDKFAKDVAEKVLDEFIYEGKTIREWVELLAKQQPCEDCISRQALIEKATSWDKHFADSERCVSLTDIQNAPSVTPKAEQKWIPCTERLPEEHEWVGTKEFGTTISDEVYVTFESPKGERFAKHLRFQNGRVSNAVQREIDAFHKGSVPVAWMPLPEPYKAETKIEQGLNFADQDTMMPAT